MSILTGKMSFVYFQARFHNVFIHELVLRAWSEFPLKKIDNTKHF